MKKVQVAWIFTVASLVLLTGAVAAVVAVVALGTGTVEILDDRPATSPTAGPSFDPSPAVTNSPTLSRTSTTSPTSTFTSSTPIEVEHPSASILLADLIRAESPNSDLTNSSSPSYMAYEWMIREDSSWLLSDVDDWLQRFALVTIWYATGGEKTWLTDDDNGWVSDKGECTWEGVQCDSSSTVQTLWLDNSGLSNAIPGEIGLLSKLTELNIERNALKGSLPTEISQLSRLSTLSLGNDYTGMGENKIIGLLDMVTRMPALEKFSCYDCGLTDPMPTTIGSMDNLKWFDLRRNEMRGTLPSELGNCNNLEGFTVGDNGNLTGPVPTELFSLPKLEALGLYGTDLTGSIPCDVVRAATIDCGKIECSPCCIQGFDEGIIQLFVPFECPR